MSENYIILFCFLIFIVLCYKLCLKFASQFFRKHIGSIQQKFTKLEMDLFDSRGTLDISRERCESELRNSQDSIAHVISSMQLLKEQHIATLDVLINNRRLELLESIEMMHKTASIELRNKIMHASKTVAMEYLEHNMYLTHALQPVEQHIRNLNKEHYS